MWENSTRKVLISAIYENIFWEKLEISSRLDIDWVSLINEHDKNNSSISIDELNTVYNLFLKNHEEYISTIKKYINHWSKTYDLIKACLICLILELEYNSPDNPEKLISKYIRIAQNLVGGENPGLVHAVSSKIIQNYKVD